MAIKTLFKGIHSRLKISDTGKVSPIGECQRAKYGCCKVFFLGREEQKSEMKVLFSPNRADIVHLKSI